MKKVLSEAFRPYSIIIETQEEHDFLRGLFCASRTCRKKECNGYKYKLDHDFWECITNEED